MGNLPFLSIKEELAMSKIHPICNSGWLALLAGLLLAAEATLVPAAEAPAPAHLALIPPDCCGFVTIRTSELFGKLGVPAEASGAAALGVADSKCVTTAVFVSAGSESVAIIETDRPLPQKKVLDGTLHSWKTVTYAGKTLHVSSDLDGIKGKRDCVLHFASPRLFLLGEEERVKKLLRPAGQAPAAAATFKAALAKAGRHDVVAWAQAGTAGSPRSLLRDVEAALIQIDCDDAVKVEARCDCTSPAGASKVEKVARLYRDMLYGQILTRCACQELGKLAPDDFQDFACDNLPLELFRQAADSLQQAHIQAAGARVSVALSIRVPANKLRSQIEAAARSADLKEVFPDVIWPFPFKRTHTGKGTKNPQDLLQSPQSFLSPAARPGRRVGVRDDGLARSRSQRMTCEEERLQKFWHDYYDALNHYYKALDHIDWVAYYKNHGYQISGGCCSGGGCRINYAPVFVSPTMQWAGPSAAMSGPPAGPSTSGAPRVRGGNER
jgi:hypothetical protein